MVMSIKEEITALEEQIANTRGPGSKDKKAELQKKLDALKKVDVGEEKRPLVEKHTGAEVRKINSQSLPPYEKVTMDQVKAAEAAGKLCGFDPGAMTASIRV